jgi:CubicO group peptidase (beta-lactamase class C family)
MPARLAAAMLLAALALPRANANDADPALFARVEAALPQVPGRSILAIDHGEVVLQHAGGVADVKSQTPVTHATNFRMASVSKQFTATAVLILVDRGQLALDDTLDQFFPGFPDYGKKITVQHLLTHTSGLPDYEELIPAGTMLQLDDLDVVQLLMDTKQPLFAPGEKWQYSNSAFALLGMIVEIVAKKPFHQFMVDEIFQPLGMSNTLLYQRGLNEVPRRAFGHELKDDRWVRADQSLTSAIRGDGVVYTSQNDFLKWLAGVESGQLLSPESHRAMFTPQAKTDRDEASYGYGWFLDEYRGERRVYHNGDTRGFRLCIHTFPERRAAVLVQLNGEFDETETPMTAVGEKMADILIFDRE